MNTQTTFSEYAPAAADRRKSFMASVMAATRSVVHGALRSMMASHLERQTVRELSSLPPHILRDIGLTHANIRGVAADLAKERADAWARQAQGSNGFGG